MALSANRNITIRNVLGQREDSMIIETSAVIFKNSLVVAKDDGLSCQPAADDTSTMFLGLAKTGPLTGDGTITCTYIYDVEANLPSSSLTAGDVGIVVYCVDDETVHSSATAGAKCGIMVKLASTNQAWIKLRSGAEMSKAS